LYDICICLNSMNLCCLLNFAFLENFQKLPGGLFITAKRLMMLVGFLGSFKEPPCDEALYRQATQVCNPFLGFSNELVGGDEFSPGDVGLFGSILMFYAFWGNFDRGKWKPYLIISDVMDYIVKLHMVGGSI